MTTQEKLDRILELLAAQPDEEAMYQRIKARLSKEAPQILEVLVERPQIRVETQVEKIKIDGKSPKGFIARLILDGWFSAPKNGNQTYEEVKRRGGGAHASARIYEACDALVALGFLYKTKTSNRSNAYVAVEGMDKHVSE